MLGKPNGESEKGVMHVVVEKMWRPELPAKPEGVGDVPCP